MAYWQLHRRWIRAIRAIVIVLGFLSLLYTLPAILFLIPSVQRWGGKQAGQTLTRLLASPVSIDRVSIDGWSGIELQGVQVLDSTGTPVLQARKFIAGFELGKSMVSRRLHITSARLFDLALQIDADSTTGRLNIQHIVDALSAPSADTTALEIDINTILLRNARVSYSRSRAQVIEVKDLNTKLSRLSIAKGQASGILDELAFTSDRELRLESLKGAFTLKGSQIRLSDLELRLPKSEVRIPNLELDFDAKGLYCIKQIELDHFDLALGDLAGHYTPLRQLGDQHFTISGRILPQPGRIVLSDLTVGLGDRFYSESQITAHLDTHGAVSDLDVQTRRLLASSRILQDLPYFIPSLEGSDILTTLAPLGQLSYTGNLRLERTEHITLSGILSTALGRLVLAGHSQMHQGQIAKVVARISTSRMELAPLLGSTFGSISGEVDAQIELSPQGDPSGTLALRLAQATLQGRSYDNLVARIDRKVGSLYNIDIKAGDNLKAEGSFALIHGKPHNINMSLDTKTLALGTLPIDTSLANAILSTTASVSLSSLDLATATGHITIPTLDFRDEVHNISLSDLQLSLEKDNAKRRLTLSTPWMNLHADATGNVDLLPQQIMHALAKQSPTLSELFPKPKHSTQGLQTNLTAQIDSIPHGLHALLNLPIALRDEVDITGHYSSTTDSLSLTLRSNAIGLSEHTLRNARLDLDNDGLRICTDVTLDGGGSLLGAGITASLRGDSLRIYSSLGHDSIGTDNGHILLSAHLSAKGERPSSFKDLRATIDLAPSKVRIHTADWAISPARIHLAPGMVGIQGLRLQTQGRSLVIEGGVGAWGYEGLQAQLVSINLRYILEAIGVDLDLIDTDLTGTILAKLEEGKLLASGRVRSPQFFVLGHDSGAIDIEVGFDSSDLLIRLDGDIRQAHGGRSSVAGWIKPANGAGINLDFDADSLDVSFVGRFLDGILNKLSGYGTGKVRLHGLFEQGVTVAGEADIRRGAFGIRTLGTHYHFDHRIKLDDERIYFDRIRLYDDEGHSGIVDGYVTHRFFDDFDINIHARDLEGVKVLQTRSPKDMPVYGTAYAIGTARLTGNGERLRIDVDMRGREGTDLTLDFNPVSAGRDGGLMRFTRLRADSLDSTSTISDTPTPETSSAIDMHLRLALTPEARLSMHLGTDMMSVITGRAEGNIQIDAPSQGDPSVFGTLAVREGEYNFRLEQIAHKRFIVREGGQIAFRGDPLRASISLGAVYALTANIADLNESLASEAGRTNIPVHCILGLSGSIERPDIRFSLELPGVDSELERRVRALLNSEDAVTRQMLYLIALGKFYTDDISTRSTATTSNWTAVASSAISEQLSSLLGSLSETIRIGTSIKTKNTAFDDTDIELLFSGSWFGDRLTVNGNIGYHDNPYLNNTYLGEFDFEYKLNKSGTLRLKGYNHYNNMYQYLRQSLMTQGLGLLFRQRFDNLSDLFAPGRNRSTLRPVARPAEADTTASR